VKAELNSLVRERDDASAAQALEQRIHAMLFADAVEENEEHSHG